MRQRPGADRQREAAIRMSGVGVVPVARYRMPSPSGGRAAPAGNLDEVRFTDIEHLEFDL
ncbi:hypothetical protein GCM10010253_66620 [Streptomyces badius]|uniref:Uncharacterized protein n=1 Tax=Streptomyces badius TaxID=1941 RepID=A0ABQ2TTJ0_STRBA|nr:hypothetical protein GCM10010253_66620 [Streptomyces badius]